MKIAVYSFCYNEQLILPYFFRHYQQYTNDITVFDNDSTDHSIDIIHSHGARLISYESENTFRDDIIAGIKNKCWKERKGTDTDWIIIVDMDEFVHHPNLVDFLRLAKEEKATVLIPRGYTMISEDVPATEGQIYEKVNKGIIDDAYSKAVIFDPNAIDEINYTVGSHYFNPAGNIRILTDPSLKLLHFHYLSLERHLSKTHERAKRLSSINLQYDWGKHYSKPDEQLADEFNTILKNAKPVIG